MRFSGFTDEWNEVTLNDVATFSKGKGISKNDISNYGIECVRYGELYTKYNEMIYNIESKTDLDKNELKLSEKNDILIPCSGETAIDLATASCIQKDQVAIGGDITVIKTNQYAPFITYYLNQKKTEIAKYAQGVSIVHLYPKDFKVMNIRIPSINEQKMIIRLLEEITKKEQLLESKYQQYQEFKKYLMQQIFTQKLRFADCTGEWNLFKLGDIVELMRNGCSENQVSFETEFPVTRIETISKGILNFDKVGYVEKIDSSYLLQYGDILLSNINSLKYIGNCVFFDEDKPLYHGMNLMLMRFKDDFNKKYLFYYMKFYQQWFQKMACQAVNQASINQSSLKKFPFYIPPTIDEQNKIVNVIDDTEHKINSIEDQIIKMEEFKKGLLQQMFVVRINWRCNFKLVKSPSFNKHLLILKNKIIFIIIK